MALHGGSTVGTGVEGHYMGVWLLGQGWRGITMELLGRVV